MALATLGCPSVRADEVPKELREWITLISGGQPALLKLDPFFIEFDRTPTVDALDPSALSQMRENVRLHPDHPDQIALRMYDLHAAHKDVAHMKLWIGRDMWRLAKETADAEGPNDFGGSNDGAWRMANGSLSVSPLKSPGINDYSRVSMSHIEYACWLLSGGMHQAFTTNIKFESLTLNGTHWRAEASYAPTEGKTIAEGEWSDHGKIRTVESFSVSWVNDGKRVSAVTVSTDWRPLPFAPYAVAGKVVAQKQTGAGEATYSLIDIGSVSPKVLKELSEVPSGSHDDPIRGSVVGVRLADHRTGKQGLIEANGIAAETPMPLPDPERSRSTLRTYGWVAGLCVVVFVVAYKVFVMMGRRPGE